VRPQPDCFMAGSPERLAHANSSKSCLLLPRRGSVCGTDNGRNEEPWRTRASNIEGRARSACGMLDRADAYPAIAAAGT
jgi:hypothetical protein